MINSIVAYDNWLDTYFAFSCHPTWSEEVLTHDHEGRKTIEKRHATEKRDADLVCRLVRPC